MNIDVPAELNGYFEDTGTTFTVPQADRPVAYVHHITRVRLNAVMAAVISGKSKLDWSGDSGNGNHIRL